MKRRHRKPSPLLRRGREQRQIDAYLRYMDSDEYWEKEMAAARPLVLQAELGMMREGLKRLAE